MLIISNDSAAASELLRGFRAAGFSVDHASEKEQGSFWARTTDYDLVLIDDKAETQADQICQRIRELGKTMPIIVVSDQPATHQKISLLDAGADDCVSKECSLVELTARARAIMRRPQPIIEDVLKLDDLVLDIPRYLVIRGKKQASLTRKEFGLLEYLLRNKGRVIPRTALIEHVWDIHADLFSNTLETHILNLRKKIEAPNKRKLIHTISGRGYKMALHR
ncbi:MAG TPA: response regulator transcription factor [Patescibacteria group bacterium]|jgi:DNA-binding response OmpR family regulator|nr:response regulator transcription factor [Patescibacteria group bacterium]